MKNNSLGSLLFNFHMIILVVKTQLAGKMMKGGVMGVKPFYEPRDTK